MGPVTIAQTRFPAAGRRVRGTDSIDSIASFLSMPGYLIQRSKQMATGIFVESCRDFGITPIQFAALAILRFCPGIDQSELGEIAALDPSTAGDVLQRLERRELVQRQQHGQRRVCDLTAQGSFLLEQVMPFVVDAQCRIVGELTTREQGQLLRPLSKMNGVDNLHHHARRGRRKWRHRRSRHT